MRDNPHLLHPVFYCSHLLGSGWEAVAQQALARDQVRSQFVALGVDPAQVETRVAALTDSELRTLAGKISEAPAGADALAIIGIVFLVLLILEAVGVIDVFKKFP